MTEEQAARLLYLLLLGAAVVLWGFAAHRGRWRLMLRNGLAWLFLFAVVIVGYGIWDEIRSRQRQSIDAEEGRI